MKKYLSVFGLFATMNFYKILSVLGLICAAEFGLLFYKFSNFKDTVSGCDLNLIIDSAYINICFLIAVLLITVFLCLSGTEYSSKVGYTLKRLSVSEKNIFLINAVYNSFAYMIIWVAQLLVIYIFCIFFMQNISGETISNQTVFLSSYRSIFFHSILPLSDVLLLIRNIILAVAFGFCTSHFSFKQRRKQFSYSLPALVIYSILFFVTNIGEIGNRIVTIIMSIFVILISTYLVYSTEEGYDE